MYHWLTDKSFLGRMKTLCSDVVNRLVQTINNEGALSVRQHLVGSGAKNLVTQNAALPVDLDYDLEIVRAVEYDINDCRGIKEYVRRRFNEVLNKAGWADCSDSTSALTTERRYFTEGDQTEFSIDLCIVKIEDDGKWYRLIHQKTGFSAFDCYFWNEARSSSGHEIRARWLKENGYWLEVREAYLNKKNMYLSLGNHDHPSFIVYIEAVNEVFWKHASPDRP